MLLQSFRRLAALWRGWRSTADLAPTNAAQATEAARDTLADFGPWRDIPAPRLRPILELPPPRQPGDSSRRYTWGQCYANLEMLWRHYGRAPRRHETDRPPSRVGGLSYVLRFGSWSATLRAFEAYRAGDRSAWPMTTDNPGNTSAADPTVRAAKSDAYRREKLARESGKVPPALRYQVLARDNNRCTACGADPKLDPTVRLQIDHNIPHARGGATTIDNLRVLCTECNQGKGARME